MQGLNQLAEVLSDRLLVPIDSMGVNIGGVARAGLKHALVFYSSGHRPCRALTNRGYPNRIGDETLSPIQDDRQHRAN